MDKNKENNPPETNNNEQAVETQLRQEPGISSNIIPQTSKNLNKCEPKTKDTFVCSTCKIATRFLKNRLCISEFIERFQK